MATTMTDFAGVQETVFHPCQEKIQEFTEVIARCTPSLYGQALRRLGNVADAEDAIQDAFLSAYTHLKQFRAESQMSTWLTTIVINSSLMKIRRRPRQTHVPLESEDQERENHPLSERLPEPGPSPEDMCRKRELREMLGRLLAQLSPKLRQAFQMREVDGLSIRDTARILNVPVGTVKARTARARAILKQLAGKNSRGAQAAF